MKGQPKQLPSPISITFGKFATNADISCGLFRQSWLKGTAKFWPTCSRVDDRYGDQHLVCSCPPLESYDYEKTKSFA